MRLRLGISFAALSMAVAQAAMPEVTKVEPPNWWAGHSINPVRLLLRGSHLQGAIVTSGRGLIPANLRINSRGTYLFVDLTIPAGTPAGEYPLLIKTRDGSARVAFRIDSPLPEQGRFQGFSPDDVIYLAMPDRFANGDPANDDPAISKGLYDRTNGRAYHGGDLQGVIDHLPYLKELGITALWLTPVYDNNNRPAHPTGSRLSTDYHGYGAIDYYSVDEHFGNLPLLRTLVDRAHARGIKVIQDQVANHIGLAHPWVEDPPTPTWLHGSVAQHLEENFQIWRLVDPNATPLLRAPVLDGWFVLGLPDLNQDDPEVARYEIQNTLWWLGTVGFDGIRQDTLPYVPRTFWSAWTGAIKRQYPKLRVVGEVFNEDPVITSFFAGGQAQFDRIDSGIDTVFDFPSFFRLRDCFAGGKSFAQEGQVLAGDRLYPHPADLVTFLGNHDVERYMSLPGATRDNLKLAFAALFTMRGTPAIYYGDELGMTGGEDPDNRADFPGGWPGDPQNAFERAGRTPDQREIFNYVKKLLALRAQLEPLRRGRMQNLALTQDSWVFMRESASKRVLVATNKGKKAEQIRLPLERDYRGLLAELGTLHTADQVIGLPPHSAEIYAAVP